MKATMSAQGVITLQAETTLEAFALRQWMSHAEVTHYARNTDPLAPSMRTVTAWSQEHLVVNAETPTDPPPRHP